MCGHIPFRNPIYNFFGMARETAAMPPALQYHRKQVASNSKVYTLRLMLAKAKSVVAVVAAHSSDYITSAVGP